MTAYDLAKGPVELAVRACPECGALNYAKLGDDIIDNTEKHYGWHRVIDSTEPSTPAPSSSRKPMFPAPATTTAITLEHKGLNWLITIERGNAEDVITFEITEMERIQLGLMIDSLPGLPPITGSVSFLDDSRQP